MLPDWNYNDPEHWGDLCSQFAICAKGSTQSPIDLSQADEVTLAPLKFDYHGGVQALFNNGHTIQLQCSQNSSLVYDGLRYTLGQFHFHHPSEHTIDGERAAMEMHLVHKQMDTGQLAVVAVLIQIGEDDNPQYAPIFDNLPAEVGDTEHAKPQRLDPSALLPEDWSHYYVYTGSLTTPPCSEDVKWIILGTPVQLSLAQVDRFADLYHNNARPLQPRNTRRLLHT